MPNYFYCLIKIMSNEILSFVEKLRIIHSKYDSVKRNINLERLIDSLKDLNSLIEMYSVKMTIIRQIEMTLVHIIKVGNPVSEKHMMHSVFYGTPGVGKSRTALILANVWKALGLLKRTPESMLISEPKKSLEKMIQIRDDFITLYDTYSNPEKKDCKSMMEKCQKDWLSIRNRLIGMNLSTTSFVDSNIIVCGREDLVAEYAGQTSVKTSKFLTGCLGKCLIIEEAYTLYLGDTDTYGMEAITVLNRFMDEHADEIMVIFTGYEDKLRDSIFKAQPGLQRRCIWFFHLQGYTAKGLCEIFINQLKESNWLIKDTDYILDFFERNISKFPNFGGDTSRLVFQCRLFHSRKIIDSLSTAEITSMDIEYILDNEDIDNAYTEYLKHTGL
jgi:hypothetical protein